MMTGLLHLHNVLRWVVLILMIWAIVKGLSGWLGKKNFRPSDRKPFLFAMISVHIQALIGIVLYIAGPWRTVVEEQLLADGALERFARFWKMEHFGVMILAFILVTVGHSRVKKGKTDLGKFRAGALFFLIALLLILAAIPWPFLGEPVARGLFPGQ